MSLMTPNGIQVRFDHDRIGPCLQPLNDGGHIGKVLADLDLWESMPNALSNMAAISAAVITKSAMSIIIYGIVGYALGTMIKVGGYSRMLKRLIPQILGSPIISIIFALCSGLYLLHDKAIVPITVLFLVVTNNGLGAWNIFEVLTVPVRLVFYKGYAKKVNFPYTRIERLFIAICDQKAKELGIKLLWENEVPEEKEGCI